MGFPGAFYPANGNTHYFHIPCYRLLDTHGSTKSPGRMKLIFVPQLSHFTLPNKKKNKKLVAKI